MATKNRCVVGGRRDGVRTASALLAAAAGTVLSSAALAGPENAQVVRGDVRIERNGPNTVIRAGDRSIINYSSFNIGAGETVRFIQPDAMSRVLNRIQGASPTRIDGSLLANGRVYIVNPAGVVFGQNAVVNVGGLFAAAGAMTDRDFLRGVDRVTGMRGAVVNDGRITTASGGSVTLAGGSVVNSGTIVAPQGAVAFAAGDTVVMGSRASNIYARVEGAADGGAGAAVTNTGTVDASGGRVLLAAGDVLGMAINTRGEVRAASIGVEGRGAGAVVVGGRLDASNQVRTGWVASDGGLGGTVRIVGQNVALVDARVDASGVYGGGRVEIGGGYRGSGDNRAQVTAVNSGTTINADATRVGDGGRVVVWADHTTRSYADISARGGTQGGNGGTIETSGKQHLTVDGSGIDASARAEGGKAGTWLMDPRNVTVTANPTSGDGDFTNEDPTVFTPNSDGSNVFAGDIESRLNAGTSVTITTGGSGSQDGDISVLADITSNSAAGTPTLRLEAADSIIIDNADITAAGGTALHVDLIANTGAGDGINTVGAVKIINGSSVVTGGGNIRIGGGTGDFAALGLPADAGYAAAVEASGARGTDADPAGVLVSGSTLDAGSGSIEIRGAGARAGDAAGVVFGAGASVTGRAVTVHGVGGQSASGDNNAGVRVSGTAGVSAGDGGLAVRGLGRGDQNGYGVHVQGALTTTGGGDISVSGASVAGGDAGHGVYLEGGSVASGTAEEVLVTGRGAGTTQSDGVRLVDGASITGDSASRVAVTGSGMGASGVGIAVEGSSASTIGGSNPDVVLLTADTVSVPQAVFTGGQIFSVLPLSSNGSMAIGTGAGGDLRVDDDFLSRLTGFAQLTFGGAGTTGTVRTAALDFSGSNTNVTIQGARIFTAGIVLGSGNVLALSAADQATQTGAVRADHLVLMGDGDFTLNHNANNINVFSAEVTGSVQYTDLDGFTVGSYAAVTGVTSSGGLSLTSQAGGITIDDTFDAGAGGATLRADEIDINAAITSGGALYLAPYDSASDIRVGGASDAGAGLDLTAGELASISGTGLLSIGLEGGTGTLSVPDAFTFTRYTVLRMGGTGGVVDLEGDVRSTGGGLGLFGATNRLGGSIVASGGDIIVNGPALLDDDVTIDATDGGAVAAGGNIELRGTVNADSAANDRALTLRNGTSGVTLGDVGGNDALASISVTAGQIALHDVRTSGGQSYTGPTSLDGDLRSLTSGDIRFENAVTLAGDSSVRTSGSSGDDITFRSTVGGTHDLATNTGVGTTILFGDVSGDAVDFQGGVVLERDVAVSGTTSVRFMGTVDSFAGEHNDLTVNSPTTTFGSAVGAGTDGSLGAFRTDSTGTTTVNGGQVIARDGVQFLDDVVLGAATTVTSVTAGVEFGKGVQSDGAARALTVNGPTGVVFRQGVGTSSGLASLTVDGATTLGGSVTTTGVQHYMDSLVLSGDSTINAGQFTVDGTLNSDGTARDLTVNTGSGSSTFLGEVGGVSVLDTIDVTSSNIVIGKATTAGGQRYVGTTTLSGDIRSTTSGPITFAGDVVLGSSVTVASAGQAASDDVNFQGKVDSQGSSRNLTVSAGQGDVAFSDAVGTTGTLLPIGTLNASGASVSLRNVRTSASQVYTGVTTLNGNLSSTGSGAIAIGGALTLAGDATLTTTAGDVVFGGTVNSDSTARNLTVNTGGSGTTRFVSAIGNNLRLASLTTNADGVTRIEGSQVRSTGDLTFNDGVVLGTNVSMEGNDITFGSTLNSDNTSTPRNLTINSSTNSTTSTDTGETAFAGLVGGTARLGLLTTNADGTTRIGDSIFTARGVNLQDAVVLVGQNITIDGSTGPLTFKSTINADTSVTDPNLVLLSGATGDADNPAFRFGGNIGATRRLGSLAIGADRATAQAGTIIFTDALDSQNRIVKANVATTDAFTVTLGTGGFNVGGGQKVVALGSLTVTTTGTARFGDVTALKDFVVNAGSIRLRNRGSAAVQSPTSSDFARTTSDAGADLVAGGLVNFNVAPTFEGTGGVFAYSTGSRQQDPELVGVVYREPLSAIDSSRFNDPRNTTFLLGLDLIASGPSTTQIGQAMIMPVPPVGAPPVDYTQAAIDETTAQELADMGVDVRPRGARDIVDGLSGRNFETDLPASVGPEGLSWQVSARRLDAAAARAVVADYRALMFASRPAEDGTTTTVNRAEEVRQDLSACWDRYAEQVKLTSGLGWRAWLDSLGTTGAAEDIRARDALVRLQRIVLGLEDMGLAPDEAKPAISRILGEVRPPQITTTEFEQAVRAVMAVSSR
ncbi:MAG: filamentous hemagglutinin N-terminal domain-containing protein [Phycisphaerales bacterium]